eukprot:gene3104-6094_t
MEFTATDNLCGQNLLRLTSRGSAIIAELLRLSSNIPEVFRADDNKELNIDQRKYLIILYDFQYFRDPDAIERKINENTDTVDLEQEFYEIHDEIIHRFYSLFESIWIYQSDLLKYIDDINNGYYIHHSLNSILDDVDGKQLLCEALYLYGIMLLSLEERIPGSIREKMLIFIYRHNTDGRLIHIDEVCKLCRTTGYIPGKKKPKSHPEGLFARCLPNTEYIRLVIGRLQSDDLYLMSQAFPDPEHRSTRLATQASMLYVILYFCPDILHSQKITMREIVDKYFNDNWVIPTYMGHTIDLTVEWSAHAAAKSAIDNVINPISVRQLDEKNANKVQLQLVSLKNYSKEGVLQQDFLLDNLSLLITTVRDSNIILRWRILQRCSQNEKYLHIINQSISSLDIITLLLLTAQLEYKLKDTIQDILKNKHLIWNENREAVAQRIDELSQYFTGEKPLTRIKRDENMMIWFRNLAIQVRELEVKEETATSTGRIIHSMIRALQDIEQFEALDTNIQIRSFLSEIRDLFHIMIRTVNIRYNIIDILETITDFSYAWESLTGYMDIFHNHIKDEPSSVILLRTTFLKTVSILDIPLVRITSINSPDAESVAEYYSNLLVEFVRTVLEIVPKSVFLILNEIVDIQTQRILPVPARLEAKDLKNHAQLELRLQMSKLTHQVSILTEGILLMKRTLLGVIRIDPKEILEEGLRRELVRLLTFALHEKLIFTKNVSKNEIHLKLSVLAMTLNGLQRSVEYIQDYLGISGLRIYHSELSRIMNYSIQQEANRYLKKKIFDENSKYQNKTIPIPRYTLSSLSSHSGTGSGSGTTPGTSSGTRSGSGSGSGSTPGSGTGVEDKSDAVNFTGRVLSALLALTDTTRTTYISGKLVWYSNFTDRKTSSSSSSAILLEESCSTATFQLLESSLGVCGLRGLDKLLAFRTSHLFTNFLKTYNRDVDPFHPLLESLRETLQPTECLVPDYLSYCTAAAKRVEVLMTPMLKSVRRLGQYSDVAVSLMRDCCPRQWRHSTKD